jgi:multiple sugar transport system permease protein
MLWVITTSLKTNSEVFSYPIQWLPAVPQWHNYADVFTRLRVGEHAALVVFGQNTAIITTSVTLGTVLSSSVVAFSLSRLQWPGRDAVFALVVITMMLPGIVILVPSFLLFNYVNLIDTYVPLIAPAWLGGGGFYIFLIRQFFLTLPVELDEAARIDGADSLTILLKVLLPLAGPVLGTVAIFSFINSYNDFLHPLIFLRSNEKYTLAMGIQFFMGQGHGTFGDYWSLLMAVAAMMLAPVVLLFFVAQRYFVRGIHLTGLAGR